MYTGSDEAAPAVEARGARAAATRRASRAASAGSERGHGVRRECVRHMRHVRQVRRRVGLVEVERGVDHGGVVQQPQPRRAQRARADLCANQPHDERY